MPIFAIGVKCMYVAFNKNAKDSYTEYTETEMLPVYYESNVVNNVNDIVVGNIYYYANNIDTLTYINYTQLELNIDLFKTQFSQYNDATRVVLYFNQSSVTLDIYRNNMESYLSINSIPMYFIIENLGNKNYYPIEFVEKVQYTDFKYVKEYQPYTYTDTLDNVFYYSVDQISNEPLFSWAKTSFLAQPLLFITNLFGLPTTSPIITFLSYWFDISIIWLVFDAIMYFPLLIHRWLDKGVIE